MSLYPSLPPLRDLKESVYIHLPEDLMAALQIFLPRDLIEALSGDAWRALLDPGSFSSLRNSSIQVKGNGEKAAVDFCRLLKCFRDARGSVSYMSLSLTQDEFAHVKLFTNQIITLLIRILSHPMVNALASLESVHLALYHALKAGESDMAKALAVSKVSEKSSVAWYVCRKTGQRTTALHVAAFQGSEAVCRHLLACGWSPNERDSSGNTPLDILMASPLSQDKRSALLALFQQRSSVSSQVTDHVPAMSTSPSSSSSLDAFESARPREMRNFSVPQTRHHHQQQQQQQVPARPSSACSSICSTSSDFFGSPALLLEGLMRGRSQSEMMCSGKKRTGQDSDSPLELLASAAEKILVPRERYNSILALSSTNGASMALGRDHHHQQRHHPYAPVKEGEDDEMSAALILMMNRSSLSRSMGEEGEGSNGDDVNCRNSDWSNTYYTGNKRGRSLQKPSSSSNDSEDDDDAAVAAAGKRKPSSSRTRRNFPAHVTSLLVAWYEAHRDLPFPSPQTKEELAQQTGLTKLQINDWFINARRRRGRQQQQSSNAIN